MTSSAPADPKSHTGKSAELYRMVLADHTCPFGVRAKALLEEGGFKVEDKVLSTCRRNDRLEGGQEADADMPLNLDVFAVEDHRDLAVHLHVDRPDLGAGRFHIGAGVAQKVKSILRGRGAKLRA
jgi:hypothetical protein